MAGQFDAVSSDDALMLPLSFSISRHPMVCSWCFSAKAEHGMSCPGFTQPFATIIPSAYLLQLFRLVLWGCCFPGRRDASLNESSQYWRWHQLYKSFQCRLSLVYISKEKSSRTSKGLGTSRSAAEEIDSLVVLFCISASPSQGLYFVAIRTLSSFYFTVHNQRQLFPVFISSKPFEDAFLFQRAFQFAIHNSHTNSPTFWCGQFPIIIHCSSNISPELQVGDVIA